MDRFMYIVLTPKCQPYMRDCLKQLCYSRYHTSTLTFCPTGYFHFNSHVVKIYWYSRISICWFRIHCNIFKKYSLPIYNYVFCIFSSSSMHDTFQGSTCTSLMKAESTVTKLPSPFFKSQNEKHFVFVIWPFHISPISRLIISPSSLYWELYITLNSSYWFNGSHGNKGFYYQETWPDLT